MQRKRWIFIAVPVAVLATTVVLVTMNASQSDPPDGTAETALALGALPLDDQALYVIGRDTAAQRSQWAWVVRDGEVVWRARLPGLVNATWRGYGLSAGDEVVTVRVEEGGREHTLGLGREDGEERWRVELLPGRGSERGRGATFSSPTHVIEYADGGRDHQALVGIERRTGEAWRHDYGEYEQARRAVVHGRYVVVEGYESVHIHRIADGEVVLSGESLDLGCVVDRFYVWHRPSGLSVVELAGLEAGDGARAARPLDLAAREIRACGTYGDEITLTLIADEPGQPQRMVGLDQELRRSPWQIDLGVALASLDQARIDFDFPAQSPLGGALTRFTPLVIRPAAGQAERQLVLVDMDAKQLVHRGRSDEALAAAVQLRAGGRHYLIEGSTVAIFDEATGRLARAVTVEGAGVPSQPVLATPEGLYVIRMSPRPFGSPAILRVSPGAATPPARGDTGLIDITEDARRRWDL